MKPETKESVERYGAGTPAVFLGSFEVRKLGLLPSDVDDLAELYVLAEGGVITRRHGIVGTVVSQWMVTIAPEREPGFVTLELYDDSGTEVVKKWTSVHWTEVADLIDSDES